MKKLCFIITALCFACLLATCVFAQTSSELLASADVYLTFEDGLKDVNGNYTVASDGDTSFTDGKFGSGASIIGGENYLTVDGWKFGEDSFTFAAWLYCNELGGDPAIAGSKYWDSGSNVGWVLCARDSDWKYNANTETGTRTDREYPYVIAPITDAVGEWYHIAMVVDRENETYQLYVNGVGQGEVDFSDKAHTSESYDDEYNEYTFNIGEDGSGLYNFNHIFDFVYDEVAVFKKALGEDEVTAIYAHTPDAPVTVGDANLAAAKPVREVPTLVSDGNGAELVKQADVHISFEDGIADDNGNYTVISNGATLADGKFGAGANCIGGTGYLTVDGFKFGADSFTFASWVYCNSASGDPVLVGNKSWDSGANPGWLVAVTGDTWKYNANTVSGTRTDNDYYYAASDVSAPVGTWYHIAVVVDRAANKYQLYINGIPQREIDFSDKAHTTEVYDDEAAGYVFNIGEDGSGMYNASQSFDFIYDEIVTFKKALSAGEVGALYLYDPNPAAEVPATETPATEVPATEAPAAETPATEAPAAAADVTKAPQTSDAMFTVVWLAIASAAFIMTAKRKVR